MLPSIEWRCASASMTALERREIGVKRGEDLINRRAKCIHGRTHIGIGRRHLGAIRALEQRLALILIHAHRQRDRHDKSGVALDAFVTSNAAVDTQGRRACRQALGDERRNRGLA